MKEGDLYARTLMRTITAGKANVNQVFHVLFSMKTSRFRISTNILTVVFQLLLDPIKVIVLP